MGVIARRLPSRVSCGFPEKQPSIVP
jgi:hypothetical protein